MYQIQEKIKWGAKTEKRKMKKNVPESGFLSMFFFQEKHNFPLKNNDIQHINYTKMCFLKTFPG